MLDKSGQRLPVLVRKDKRLIHEGMYSGNGDEGGGIKLVVETKIMLSEIKD